MVISDRCAIPAPLEAQLPKRGSIAIPNKAANHTANRVFEFCGPMARSTSQASSAITMPSTVQFNILSAESWARIEG
jgi:hypothetical protein